MKKWIITGLVVAAIAVTAASVHWWLPKLLPFLKENTVVIQTLGSTIQIVLWIVAGIIFVVRLWLSRKEGQDRRGGNNVSQTAQGGGYQRSWPGQYRT